MLQNHTEPFSRFDSSMVFGDMSLSLILLWWKKQIIELEDISSSLSALFSVLGHWFMQMN